jgi:hypothetical protein
VVHLTRRNLAGGEEQRPFSALKLWLVDSMLKLWQTPWEGGEGVEAAGKPYVDKNVPNVDPILLKLSSDR